MMDRAKLELERYLRGKLTPDELIAFQRRVAEEPGLRAEVDLHLASIKPSSPEEAIYIPASQEMLVKYVEGDLDPHDVELVETLLELDPVVRDQVAELRANRIEAETLFTRPNSRQTPAKKLSKAFFLALGMATACTGIAFFLLRGSAGAAKGGQPQADVVAALDRVRVPKLYADMAASGRPLRLGVENDGLIRPVCAAVESDRPTLIWKPVLDAARYHIEVLDAKKKLVFTSETRGSETRVNPPLRRGESYAWTMTALDEKGNPIEVVTSGGDLPGWFMVLSSADIADLQRMRQSANPSDSIAAEIHFGLFDEAMTEVQTDFDHLTDPAVRASMEKLRQRIANRRN